MNTGLILIEPSKYKFKGIMLKNIFSSLVLICLIGSFQSLTSNEKTSFKFTSKNIRGKVIDDRIYLHPGMAHVTPQGLVVQLNGEPLSVPTIESDEYGVFIRTPYAGGRVQASDWCCTSCWHWNSSNRLTCRVCGSDRDD